MDSPKHRPFFLSCEKEDIFYKYLFHTASSAATVSRMLGLCHRIVYDLGSELDAVTTQLDSIHRADIQKRGSILAWIVILSVYGADTIAEVNLLISPFLR